MHSPDSPPSSGSSRSGSPDTRATTPSSPPPERCAAAVQPATYLCVPAARLTPAALAELFAKHAVEGRMGLVLSAAEPVGGEWATAKLGELEYRVAEAHAYEPHADYTLPYVPTAPAHAAHLRLLARAGLRSVLAMLLGIDSDTSGDGCTAHVLERPSVVFVPVADARAASLLPAPVAVGDDEDNATHHNDHAAADYTVADDDNEAPTPAMRGNVPTLAEWDALWAAWDAVTLGMIPPEMLHDRPIDLRHKCLFYIGHIPTFLDMLLSKAVGGAPTEPAWFWTIFERGIDPHVDDPDHCHNHSAVPTNDADWPSLAAVLAFRDGVRARLRGLYTQLAPGGGRPLTRGVARMLVMTHEHEAFHVETLLYMLIQKAGCGPTRAPPGVARPPWEALAAQWAAAPRPESGTVLVPAGEVVLGQDDSEADDFVVAEGGEKADKADEADKVDKAAVPAAPGHTYGWDNESPARRVRVRAFRAEWRCVTNAEFFAFWRASNASCATTTSPNTTTTPIPLPKSWLQHPDGSIHVRTLFGPVPLATAASWPVLASHDALAAYARARGGRLPAEPELRRFLDLYDVGYDGGANVGMRNWHPVPGTMGLGTHGGRGTNGGVWEWTATEFAAHDGLVPTALFTGYSEDFFDGKHVVALGASYATLPRLGRRTVRNFYQHNYPYPWIGARVVYDV